MGYPNKHNSMQIVNLIVRVEKPTKLFKEELAEAQKNQSFMYLDRLIYGIPEMVMEDVDGSLTICVLPVPDLLDPWALTQDLKDYLEEGDDLFDFDEGDFDDTLE